MRQYTIDDARSKAKPRPDEVTVEPKRRIDPSSLSGLQNDVDRMFLELLRSERVRRYGSAALRPNADVYFDSGRGVLVVKLELAGIDPDAIDLEVDEGVLRISGMRLDAQHPDAIYQQMEISYGRFERVVRLPREVDSAKASASYCNGFLEIDLPLKQRAGRRRIAISTQEDESVASTRDEGPGAGDRPADEGRR